MKKQIVGFGVAALLCVSISGCSSGSTDSVSTVSPSQESQASAATISDPDAGQPTNSASPEEESNQPSPSSSQSKSSTNTDNMIKDSLIMDLTPATKKAFEQHKIPDKIEDYVLVAQEGALESAYTNIDDGITVTLSLNDGSIPYQSASRGVIRPSTFNSGSVLCGSSDGMHVCYARFTGSGYIKTMIVGAQSPEQAAQITLDMLKAL